MFEPVGLLRINSEKVGRSSPEQNKHIYTKILQNSSSSILSARTSKTNSKTPYELNILQEQTGKNDRNGSSLNENLTEKEFKSIYSTNQLTSSIDLKGINFKQFQESANNVNNISNDNSRNMRKSLENLNIYTKSKTGDKYNELKQSIMNQIKFQNFKEFDEKNSSRDNSKQHSSNSNLLSNHKSALNYFSLNQNNKNIKSANVQNNTSNQLNSEKPPPSTNKNFKKINIVENAISPEKKSTNKNTNNSIKKEKKPLDNNNNSINNNSSHLHSNKKNGKFGEKYYEILEKSNKKQNMNKNTNFNTKDGASHSFQQNPSKNKMIDNLNNSDNSQLNSAHVINISNSNAKSPKINENIGNDNQNPFDFTMLKSYNDKLLKHERVYINESNERIDKLFLRENPKKDLRGTPPKKRELTKSLPASTKNSSSSSSNFKQNLNENILNNKAYNLLKSRREEESKENNLMAIGYSGYLKSSNPNVKVNDLLNEEFKSNSEKLIIKNEKEKCEECEQKMADLETIYEKVRQTFDTHRKKEASWFMEKAFYIKQIDYLNTLIKQFIQEKTT